MFDRRIDRAIELYDSGECRAAIRLLLEVIDTWPPDKPPYDRKRAQLYLSSMYFNRGQKQIAMELLGELERDVHLDLFLRSHLSLELAKIHLSRGKTDLCLDYLGLAANLIDFNVGTDEGSDPIYLVCSYHIGCGRYFDKIGKPEKAIEHYLLARDRAISIEHKILATVYINLANSHAVIGERELARSDLALAYSVLKSQETPYAYGLVHYFETLATFNLFIYDSKEKAIHCLSKISEEVVNDMDEFKRVFDFFGELLVQCHGEKFELDKLKAIEKYYDDPLVRAYLPSLIAGAPRPGEEPGRFNGTNRTRSAAVRDTGEPHEGNLNGRRKK